MQFLLEKSEQSLFQLEKLKSSSDHPSIKVIYAVLLLTRISYFLQTLQDIFPHRPPLWNPIRIF